MKALIVVTENANYAPATAADSNALRAKVGPDWIVAYEPGRALETYGSTELAIVLKPDQTVVFKRQAAPRSDIENAITGVLAGSP